MVFGLEIRHHRQRRTLKVCEPRSIHYFLSALFTLYWYELALLSFGSPHRPIAYRDGQGKKKNIFLETKGHLKTKLRYDVTIVPDLGGVWNEIDAQGLLKEHGKIRYHQQKRNRK